MLVKVVSLPLKCSEHNEGEKKKDDTQEQAPTSGEEDRVWELS